MADEAPLGDWLTLRDEQRGSVLDARRVDAPDAPEAPLEFEGDSSEEPFFEVEYRDSIGALWRTADPCGSPEVFRLFWEFWRKGRIKRQPGRWVGVKGGPDIPA
jgi:hypothetical protein